MLLLLAAQLLPVAASAADWTRYGSSDAGDAFEYDKQSVYRQSDGHMRVWTRTTNTIELLMCAAKCDEMSADMKEACISGKQLLCPDGNPHTSMEPILYEFSCTGQFRTLSDKKTGDWSYIKPTMYIADLERLVCK